MMGLKLLGYMNTLDKAAITINSTAMIYVYLLCLFILYVLLAKISNYSFLKGI
jgi:hypothetical protein